MFNTLLGGGIFIGILMGFWNQIKDFSAYLKGLLITTIWISKYDSRFLYDYLVKNGAVFVNNGNTVYESYFFGQSEFPHINNDCYVPFEKLDNGSRIVRLGWRFLFIRYPNDVTSAGEHDGKINRVRISTFRFMINPDKLYKELVEEKQSKHNHPECKTVDIVQTFGTHVTKFSKIGSRNEDSFFEKTTSVEISYRYDRDSERLVDSKDHIFFEKVDKRKISLNDIYINDEQKKIITEIEHWKDDKEWYDLRGVPWRRGYLIHGLPGTGKTAFIRAVAVENSLNIICPDLSSFSNQEFVDMWERTTKRYSPCIILLEDIDSVFEGRTNKTECPLTFDKILNCIDGISDNSGTLLFITTNNIEKVDKALGGKYESGRSTDTSRPGRIDRTIEFGYLDRQGKKVIGRKILRECFSEAVITDEEETAAQFQERCIQRALELKEVSE